MHSQRTVIVGAGQAGGTVAATLRQLGHTGTITLIGDEAWPPYERPPLSKGLLQAAIEVEKTFLRPSSFYVEQGISLFTGRRVQAIERRDSGGLLHLDAGEPVPYHQLVLATGARARRLAVPGADHPSVHSLRSIDDALRLRLALTSSNASTTSSAGPWTAPRLLIVGGGFIGLEIAASARALGARVTLIEQAPQLMGRVLPAAVAAHLAGLHDAHGVSVRTGVALRGFDPLGKALVADTSAGPIEADVVAVGVGSVPNTELALAAGLVVDDGIVVDSSGRTNDPCIWATGDVTRHFNPLLQRRVRLESWKNAQNQSLAVARSLMGQHIDYAELPWLWTDQYELNLQLTGLPQGSEELVWRGAVADGKFTVFGLIDRVPRYAITANQGRDMRFAQRLILRGQAVDLVALSDVSTPLQRLAA